MAEDTFQASLPATQPSQFIPEEMKRRQMMYQLLAKQAADTSSPIYNKGTGLAKVAEGALAGWLTHSDNEENKAANAANSAQIQQWINGLNGGGAAPQAAPVAPAVGPQGAPQGASPAAMPAPQGMSAPVAPQADTTGKIYNNDEPSPLDPPSGADNTKMLATMLGEQKAGSPAGLGVANTIRNRAVDGGYGGDTPSAVVTAPKQYSPWNDETGRARMAAALKDPVAVAKAQDQIDQAYGVGKYVNAGPNDPTEGKTHFYDPGSMVPPNSVPSWAKGKEAQKIGSTLFFDDPNDPAALPSNSQMAQGQGNPVTPQAAATSQALAPQGAGVNPQQKALAMQLLMDERTPPAMKQFILQQNDPARNLDMQTKTLALKQAQENAPLETEAKRLANEKARSDLNDTPNKTIDFGTDPMTGKKDLRIYDSATKTFKKIDAQDPQSSPTGSFATITDAVAKGAKPEDVYQHVPTEIREVVKGVVEGRGFPASLANRGNVRNSVMQYAHAVDPSFDEALLPQRQTYARSMGSLAPSSVGGQKVLLGTSLGHLADVSDSATAVANSDGGGIAPVAHAYNSLRAQGTEQAAKVNALEDKAQKFSGEVGKLYSGSQGGGVHEREETRSRMGGNKSSAELAAGLEANRDLILSKLQALEQERDQVFGTGGKNRIDFMTPQVKESLDKIQANIDKLRGKSPEGEAQATGPDPAALAEAKRRGLIK